jgi:hypothetical protein
MMVGAGSEGRTQVWPKERRHVNVETGGNFRQRYTKIMMEEREGLGGMPSHEHPPPL